MTKADTYKDFIKKWDPIGIARSNEFYFERLCEHLKNFQPNR